MAGCALVLLLAVPSPTLATTAGPERAAAGGDPAENPFDGARKAEEAMSFAGSVRVTWDDARGPHSEQLDVRAVGGTITFQGESTVVSRPGGVTMVRHPEGDWDLLWTGAATSGGRPDVEAKYDVEPVDQPVATMVASRPTRLVEVRQAGAVRERLFLDAQNGLLLRREQLDLNGHAVHTVAFSSIDVDADVPPPSVPTRVADDSPHHLASVSAPADLPGGYRRVDAYRDHGATQVLYSDGLYDLSVFEQRGGLSGHDVPSEGKPVRVGPVKGWVYAWPGGQVLLWHRGHTVFSLVSEAPADQLVTAARALPAAGGSSLVTRLRRVCRNLVQPLAG